MKLHHVIFGIFTMLTPIILSAAADPVHYGTGTWDAATLGNQRAVVTVEAKAPAVLAHIPWRRRDAAPENKAIIVVEAATGKRVANALPLVVTGPAGDLVFEAKRPGTYFVYYLPYRTQGENYPKVTYLAPEATATSAWLDKNGLKETPATILAQGKLPQASLVEIQAINEFGSPFPMEVVATPEEMARLLAAQTGKTFLLFPEDRMRPIRMTTQLPQKWVEEGPKTELAGTAQRGEFYAFQTGLFANAAALQNVAVTFGELRDAATGKVIPASALRCINSGGINWDGTAFKKTISVPAGHVQALWCGVQVDKGAVPGIYRGQVSVQPQGLPAQTVTLSLTVAPEVIADAGDDEPWRHSRLRWLDSTLAVDNQVIRPFTPIKVAPEAFEILGRRLALAPSGLPARVDSFYVPEVTKIGSVAKPVLTGPMALVAEDAAGQPLPWVHGTPKIIRQEDGLVEWSADSTAGLLRMQVRGSLEPDGFIQYRVTVSATAELPLHDLRLEIPMARDSAKYMMGLGQKGGLRPAGFDWTWDVKKNQDGAWIGDANAGLQFTLMAENYSRPLNTNFYHEKPLNLPPSWCNDGHGGIAIHETPAGVLVKCFGGERILKPGQDLHFDFKLLLTPFKPLDVAGQWRNRFFHSFKPVAEVIKAGSNTVNVHHANNANPYINYPFLHQREMKEYIAEAHRQGLKVKIYYTIRELSNHAPELFALFSLGDEIFSKGPGGGDSWLQEHLEGNYIAAWYVPEFKDAAVINSGMSRWHNYYIEGLDWLVRNMQIDGLYLDDIAYDRVTMKRVRKVLDQGRPESLIDLHSANQYNPRDGFASSANLYLEHFPYINRLWFGEYFNPDSPPDFWFIEMSGIPYGLMSEMLQDGGNRWRGMLYGMTARMPYLKSDPSPVWKVWDDFKIQESEMFGYWSPRCPVQTGRADVLATAYVAPGRTLISIASWAKEETQVKLAIDWKALGLDPAKAVLVAPKVKDFQPSARFKPTEAIPVPAGKGWLLVVKEE
jgi:hypothetical protein